MERDFAGMGLPSWSSLVRTAVGGEHRVGRGGGGRGRTAFDADGGEAEVALVGEVAAAGVAPRRGEDEVDHGAGEEGREEARGR